MMRDPTGQQGWPGDAEIQAALRELHPPVQLSESEAIALRRKISAGAELPLARRRRIAAPPPSRGSWTRRLVPAAAAASIAFGIWIGGYSPPSGTLAAGSLGEVRGVPASDEEILGADVTEQEFRLLVSGRADSDELLLIAIGEI